MLTLKPTSYQNNINTFDTRWHPRDYYTSLRPPQVAQLPQLPIQVRDRRTCLGVDVDTCENSWGLVVLFIGPKRWHNGMDYRSDCRVIENDCDWQRPAKLTRQRLAHCTHLCGRHPGVQKRTVHCEREPRITDHCAYHCKNLSLQLLKSISRALLPHSKLCQY